jgi:hypothetical protein
VEACSLGNLAIGIHATAAPAVAGKGPAIVAKLTNPKMIPHHNSDANRRYNLENKLKERK